MKNMLRVLSIYAWHWEVDSKNDFPILLIVSVKQAFTCVLLSGVGDGSRGSQNEGYSITKHISKCLILLLFCSRRISRLFLEMLRLQSLLCFHLL